MSTVFYYSILLSYKQEQPGRFYSVSVTLSFSQIVIQSPHVHMSAVITPPLHIGHPRSMINLEEVSVSGVNTDPDLHPKAPCPEPSRT